MTYTPGYAGPVTITVNGSSTTRAAYTAKERGDIIRQGRERPRLLGLDESTLAAKNRRVAREDLLAAEVWYRTQCVRNGQLADTPA